MIELYQTIIKEAPAICGVLFIVASMINSETGKIFYGSIIYLIADVILVLYSVSIDDVMGVFFLSLAVLFSSRILIKMHKGKYVKKLHKKVPN